MAVDVAQAALVPGGEPAARAGKHLTFRLGDEEYGLQILKVREIIGLLPITLVPRTPSFIRGVINLRGRIIPVVDLRDKFGLPRVEDTELTCIIVVDVLREGRPLQMGVIVDSVSEVLDIADGEIEEAPSFGAAVNTDFILGLAKSKGGVKILLNIDDVLSDPGIIEMAKAGAASGPDPA